MPLVRPILLVRGVLPLHPSSGVRSSPPSNASEGSSGTADVASRRRLRQSSFSHSDGDLLVAGALRRSLWALEAGAGSVSGSILTSDDIAGTCPVTTTRQAFSSGFSHKEYRRWTIPSTGHCVALHCFSHQGNEVSCFKKCGGDTVRVP